MLREGALQLSNWREFQRVGAATLKARYPKVRTQESGMERRPESEDRKVWNGVWGGGSPLGAEGEGHGGTCR